MLAARWHYLVKYLQGCCRAQVSMGINNLPCVPGVPGELGLLKSASPSLLLPVLATQFVYPYFNQTFDYHVCLIFCLPPYSHC